MEPHIYVSDSSAAPNLHVTNPCGSLEKRADQRNTKKKNRSPTQAFFSMHRQKGISSGRSTRSATQSIGTLPPISAESSWSDKPMCGEEQQDENLDGSAPNKPKLSAVVRTATAVKEYFKDYCNATAIHGVRYFAEDGRSYIEKIFWVVAITLSMMGCFHLIQKVWDKWDTSPVIVSFAESSTSIWQVPFPAVSVCPVTKSRQTVFNFTEKYYTHEDYIARLPNTTTLYLGIPENNVTEDLDQEDLDTLEAVSLLCYKDLLTTGADTITEDMKRRLEKVAPQHEEMIFICQWRGQMADNCTNLFRPVWSDEGLCFTFNMLDNRELFTETTVQYGEHNTNRLSGGWDLEKGYPFDGELYTFPNRALGAGESAGLSIVLFADKNDLDYLCRGAVQGFKILLHDPAEIPRVGQQYFRAPMNQEIIAAVKPSMMTTSPGLRDYPAHRRRCYFPRERQLRFFQVYTQKNCELECITNFTLKECGCVQFYMPRDNDTLICGPGKNNCSTRALEKSVQEEIRHDLESHKRGKKPGFRKTDCDCLTSCISLEYTAETSQADLNWKSVLKAYRSPLGEKEEGLFISRITIFFKDTQFITSHRSELYGQTDFLANCGGLLGLFTGFSFISLIEILYFLTIRLWCQLNKRAKRLKSSAASQPTIRK